MEKAANCLFSRRTLLALLGISPTLAAGRHVNPRQEGMASRKVRAAPRRAPSGKPYAARFTDIGRRAGLTYPTISGHPQRADYVIEAMGCGCAFIDYDNDGWMDLLVLSSSRLGDPPGGSSNRLYKNNRNGTFQDVTERAGLFRSGYHYGVAVGDFNNDGYEDVFLTGYPQNVLYRNNGDGTFADITKHAGLLNADARFGSGCTFFDYDRDGKLDLFVSNYVLFDTKNVPPAGTVSSCNPEHVFCGPRGLPYGRHSLYRNNGDGTFTDVTAEAGISKPDAGYGLTAVAADFERNGRQDVYLACDSTPSLFFSNQGNGTFLEQGLERGVALSEDGMEQAGMGIAIGDLTGSGNLDLVKTHFAADTPAVYVNTGKGEFRDETLRSGLAVETRYISWGIGIEDFDNDGDPDIFWVTGGIYPELQNRPDQPFQGPRILFRNLGGGKFEELSIGLDSGRSGDHCSRGCAFGDFDNDGDIDILIVNLNEPPTLLRNDTLKSQHWLKVKLTGVQSNRSGIGACVIVRYAGKVQAKTISSQSSYLSANDPRLHFGLGSADEADVEIRWPSGRIEHLKGVIKDQLIHVTEGGGITRRQAMG